MPLRIGELDDLVFDRRTVARPSPADGTAVQRRLEQVFLNDVLELRSRPSEITRELGKSIRSVEEREPVRLCLPVLPLKATQIEAPPVDPGGVPVLKRSIVSPSLPSASAISTAGASPALPAGI